jgi:hypothetical protein
MRLRLERRQARILGLVPAVLGLYCAVQGLVLLDSQEPLIQALGVALFLWVPGCAYFSWKARKALLQAEPAKVASTAKNSVPALGD